MATRRRWQDLTTAERIMTVIMGIVQIGLLAAAQRDLSRRPAEGIRGSKRMWRALTLVNYVGPLAYFLFGVVR